MTSTRLTQQLEFIVEIDRLKDVMRQSYLMGANRRENSAEHSWHLAMMALLLAEHAPESLDQCRVMKMLLIHDIVEIDAGDTYCYDPSAREDQAERERQAAKRLFGLLPREQADEFYRLWGEFEARNTPEARFAAAVDRLMPLLHGYYTQGRSWQEHNVTVEQVLARNRMIQEGSPTLWGVARRLIQEAVERGYLAAPDGVPADIT